MSAARAGDRAALDTLVVESLPLVYNIVRRALPADADVDDVVQDTMVRLVRGIDGLRDPARFRSWLVAITMNQIRDDRLRSRVATTRTDEYEDRPDPDAEFVDRALTKLDLQRQRQEINHAVSWLPREDRELLSLWTLERGGHLTRAEIADVLRQDAHNVTVRVSRVKTRLDGARLLVRAFTASPRCPELASTAKQWPGTPSPLWRKRLLRHVNECERCRAAGSDLAPADRVLLGAGLVPLPLGYRAQLLAGVHDAEGLATAIAPIRGEVDDAAKDAPNPAAEHTAAGPGVRNRGIDVVAAKPGLVTAAVAGVCAVALAVVIGLRVQDDTPPAGTASSRSALTGPESSLSTTRSPSTTSAMSSATAGTTTTIPTTTPTTSPTTTPTTVKPAPPPPTTTTEKPDSPEMALAKEVLAITNAERAKAGCEPVVLHDKLTRAAQLHSEDMAANDYFDHASQDGRTFGDRTAEEGYEGFASGENIAAGQTSAQDVMGAWMNSEGHRNNILNCGHRHMGLGVVPDQWLWTQVFGA